MVESRRGVRLTLTSIVWSWILPLAVFPHAMVLAGQTPPPSERQEARPASEAKPEVGKEKSQPKEAKEAPAQAKSTVKAAETTSPASEAGKNPNDSRKGDLQSRVAEFLSRPGDEAYPPFVPLHPRTVEERRQIDAVRLYGSARALELQGQLADAAALLQEALKLDPDSVAIPKRLSWLYVGPLGNPELATQFGKKVLQVEPGDVETLTHLVDYYTRQKDSAGAEALLKEVLANPKLDARGPGRLMAEFELGRICAARPDRVMEAADHFAQVIELLDDRSASQLSPQESTRILGNAPASAYLVFGRLFLSAKRPELAARAFERGLVYDQDNPQIPLVLAETLLSLGKGDRALALVDRFIRRQTQVLDSYELLAKVLKALNRENEITPRLEEAAKRDSKNVPLQYVLADRYRETGQVEKAEELYKKLLGSQPTPQTYRALAQSLLRRKKYDELLKVLGEAYGRGGLEIIRPQLDTIVGDPGVSDAVLDSAYRIVSNKFDDLPRPTFVVLALLANQGAGDKTKKLEKLLQVQKSLLDQSPSPQELKEIFDTYQKLGKFSEAVDILEKLIARYPGEKTIPVLLALAESQHRAGKDEAAFSTTKEALKLAPPDFEAQGLFAELLTRIGQVDEAVSLLRKVAKNEPNNPAPTITLGSILTRFGRNEEAIELFKDLLKRHGDNEEVVRVARQSLSVIYVNQGEYTKGEAELEALLERNPDEAGVNNDLGYLYAEQGKNLEKAEAMIRKAVLEEPENYAYLDSLGWVLFKRGKTKEALDNLKKAVDKLDRPDPTILEHLGDVYLKLQEIPKAKDAWRKAQEAAAKAQPPDKRLEEIRKKLDSLDKLSPAPKPASDGKP